MRPIKDSLCLTTLLCLCLTLSAQVKEQQVSIGEKVPEVVISNILNNPTGEIKLSDYKGKWVVLDFWATWCTPCVAAFPKIDSLQKLFSNDVKFIPITYQYKEEVEVLMAKLERLKGYSISLPLVISDTILHTFFPHKELPLYVWIDPEGVVKAITDGNELSAGNIEALLDNNVSVLESKKYVPIPFNQNELLLTENKEMPEKPVRFQSALLPYIEGLSGGYTVFPNDPVKGKRVLATNARLLSLFQLAYSSSDLYFSKNRIILEVKDTSAFIAGVSGPEYTEWLKSGHSWCYELIIPNDRSEDYHYFMQDDLKRYFPQYEVVIEKHKRNCLALVRTSKKDKIKSRGGTYKADMNGSLGFELRNGVFIDLVARLNAYYLQRLPTPILDETNYPGRIDLLLDANLANVESIRKALQAYDLDLIEVERKIEVLVIKDSLGI